MSYVTSKKWAYSGIAENCNLEQASHSKTIGKSRKQRRGKEGIGRPVVEGPLEAGGSIVVSYWLRCHSLSLAGLLPEGVESPSSFYWAVK